MGDYCFIFVEFLFVSLFKYLLYIWKCLYGGILLVLLGMICFGDVIFGIEKMFKVVYLEICVVWIGSGVIVDISRKICFICGGIG